MIRNIHDATLHDRFCLVPWKIHYRFYGDTIPLRRLLERKVSVFNIWDRTKPKRRIMMSEIILFLSDSEKSCVCGARMRELLRQENEK